MGNQESIITCTGIKCDQCNAKEFAVETGGDEFTKMDADNAYMAILNDLEFAIRSLNIGQKIKITVLHEIL